MPDRVERVPVRCARLGRASARGVSCRTARARCGLCDALRHTTRSNGPVSLHRKRKRLRPLRRAAPTSARSCPTCTASAPNAGRWSSSLANPVADVAGFRSMRPSKPPAHAAWRSRRASSTRAAVVFDNLSRSLAIRLKWTQGRHRSDDGALDGALRADRRRGDRRSGPQNCTHLWLCGFNHRRSSPANSRCD